VAPAACWGLGACCWSLGGARLWLGEGAERRSEYGGRVRPVDVLVTPPFQSLEITSRSTCAPPLPPAAPSAPPKLGRARLWPSVNRGWHAVRPHAGPLAPASSPGRNGEELKS
jgi:hypothetical protein